MPRALRYLLFLGNRGSLLTMAAAGETTYSNIIYRKSKGSVVLNIRGLFFRPQTGSSDDDTIIALNWNEIAKHQVSPASHSKSLLW